MNTFWTGFTKSAGGTWVKGVFKGLEHPTVHPSLDYKAMRPKENVLDYAKMFKKAPENPEHVLDYSKFKTPEREKPWMKRNA